MSVVVGGGLKLDWLQMLFWAPQMVLVWERDIFLPDRSLVLALGGVCIGVWLNLGPERPAFTHARIATAFAD